VYNISLSEETMLNKTQLDELVEYFAGSCVMGGGSHGCELVLGREITEDELDQMHIYFEESELFECSQCSWYGHPGDGYDEDMQCDNCAEYGDE
jgi:hypothetical protein